MHTCLLAVFFLSLGLVYARPPPDLALRQIASVTVPTALASPTSYTTTTTVQTPNGTMTETCVLTFIPDGQQIQEIQNCTLSMGGSQATSTPSATATAPSAFVMPGTSIQVLPIGLGIFGGITAIGAVAVAYVTWERVRSRKSYRQQRMTESSLPGYGGVLKGGLAN